MGVSLSFLYVNTKKGSKARSPATSSLGCNLSLPRAMGMGKIKALKILTLDLTIIISAWIKKNNQYSINEICVFEEHSFLMSCLI